jgi:3-hydroxyacyl-[acyl-carrier-protein] dehydratase
MAAAWDFRGCRVVPAEVYCSFYDRARRRTWLTENQIGGGLLAMRFNLVDRIVEVEPGKRLRAVKNLTLGEEYLADHFPTFPVMPGVMMLQTLVEAGAWLLRLTDDFRHSVIVLREAKNVKYGAFMDPGRQMQVTVDLVEQADSPEGPLATLKGKGEVDGNQTVSARLTVVRYNLRDRDPALQAVDDRIVTHLRSLSWVLRQGAGPEARAG